MRRVLKALCLIASIYQLMSGEVFASRLLVPIREHTNQNITKFTQELKAQLDEASKKDKEVRQELIKVQSQLRLCIAFNQLFKPNSDNIEYKIITKATDPTKQYQLTLTEDNTDNGIMGYNLNANTIVITDTRNFCNNSRDNYCFINVGDNKNIILFPRPRGMVFEGFNDNSTGVATINGSAIHCNNLTAVGLSILTNCHSGNIGGAIFCKGIFNLSPKSVMKLIGNSSTNGGAIFCKGIFNLNPKSVMKLIDNSSTNGGAIRCDNTFTMNGGSIEAINNKSSDWGGAIYCNNTFTMNQGSIMKLNNNSGNGGGAIWCNTFTMNQGSIEANNNISRGDGGAIWCYNSITLITTGNISAVRDPSNYQELENIASVYFYGNRDRVDKPNDIYIWNMYSRDSNLTIDGDGICAMYGGVRSKYNDITITKDGKGLWILGNILDMKDDVNSKYLSIHLNNGVLCLLATINDLNSYPKANLIMETTGNSKLVVWLAKQNTYYDPKYYTKAEAHGEIRDLSGVSVASTSLLKWMKDNANSYFLQEMPQ